MQQGDRLAPEFRAAPGALGRGLRLVQTGRVQNYALGIAIGLLVMAGSFLVIVAAPR